MRSMIPVVSTVSLLLSLAACGKQPEIPKPGEPQGRVETQGLRNAEALGYSGAAIGNKVDAALDANDQRKAALDHAMDAEGSP